jgi:hypothetical protein
MPDSKSLVAILAFNTLALQHALALRTEKNTTVPMELAEYDRTIAPYVAQARATYPAAKRRFLAGLP